MDKEIIFVIVSLIIVGFLIITINLPKEITPKITQDEGTMKAMKEWEMYCGSIGADNCLEEVRWIKDSSEYEPKFNWNYTKWKHIEINGVIY